MRATAAQDYHPGITWISRGNQTPNDYLLSQWQGQIVERGTRRAD